jgi:flagellar basal body-associated protein FliL
MASKKKKLMLVGALLLIGGGAVAGYQALLSGEPDNLPPPLPKPAFMDLDPFLAPVIEGRRIIKYVSLGITLELSDESYIPHVHQNNAPLRDSFLNDLLMQAQMARGSGRPVYLPQVKARFRVLARRVLGEDVVEDVLIRYATDRGF